MLSKDIVQSVLIVSASAKAFQYFKEILPAREFCPITMAKSAVEAKQKLIEADFDIVIINAPLADDMGTNLAVDIVTETSAGVMMLVMPEVYEQVAYKMEQFGVLTLVKNSSKIVMFQTIKLLSATSTKMRSLQESTHTLEQKLKDMKTVNKAKGILIEVLKMSEDAAHKYIEKEAMDSCVKKVDIARQIIEKYEV